MNRRRLTILASAAAAIAILVPATPASAGLSANATLAPAAEGPTEVPTAQKSGEELVTFITTGKLKVRSEIDVFFQCSVDCAITSSAEIVLPGPNFKLPDVSGSFLGGAPIVDQFTPNKALRSFIKKNLKKSKLRVELTATNITTGEVDVDKETFKFKK